MIDTQEKPFCTLCEKRRINRYAVWQYKPAMGANYYLCDNHKTLLHDIYIGSLERIDSGTDAAKAAE